MWYLGSSSSSWPPIIRHPGTCTFQRSQPACTFSLLCYLAGGVPVEGCGGDLGTTCCMLNNSPQMHFPLNSMPPPVTSSSPPSFNPSSPPHSFGTSNSQNHDYPYHFGHPTPPTLDPHTHNTIRRTRPAGNIKPIFREVSNRKMFARNLGGEDCKQNNQRISFNS
jgi:hypothetical protein